MASRSRLRPSAQPLLFGAAPAVLLGAVSLPAAGCAPDFTVTTGTTSTSETSGGGGATGTGGTAGGASPGGEPVWAVAFSGSGDAQARALTSAGDTLILAMDFTGAFTTADLMSAGSTDIAVARLSPAGTVVGAGRYGDANPQSVRGAASNGADGFYLTGEFSGFIGEGATTAAAAGLDGFIARLDTTGALSWVQPLGGAGSDTCRSVARRADGDIVVAGTFTGEVDFGDQKLQSMGGSDVFVAVRGPSGAPVLTTRIGDVFAQRAVGAGVDPEGNTTVLYDTERPGGTFDIQVMQMDDIGQSRWEKVIGTAGDDHAASMAVDASGHVLVAGYKAGGLDLGAGVVGARAFVALYDKDGNLTYGRGLESGAELQIGAVALDAVGHAVVVGAFAGKLDVGSISATSAGGLDAFVLELDTDGQVMWMRAFGDGADQTATALLVEPDGNIAVAGQLGGTVLFGAQELGPAIGTDGYLVVLTP